MGFKKINVSKDNLNQAFEAMAKLLQEKGDSYVAVDTEFPGTVTKSKTPYNQMTMLEKYANMRENVNDLKLIQLGLTVCDRRRESTTVWEFNFKDFDFQNDRKDPTSFELLKSSGIDFVRNLEEGIAGADFAKEFQRYNLSGLNLTWVFFHCTYDLGYLIKILTQEPLPESVDEFMGLVQKYLGKNVFDVKEMVNSKPFDWSCGLNKVAQKLKVEREGGESHQAGSDSLLTLRCFLAIKEKPVLTKEMWEDWNYQLHGFDKPKPSLIQMKIKYQPYYPRSRLVAYDPRSQPFQVYGPQVVADVHHLPVTYPHFVYPQPHLVTNPHCMYPQFVATV